MSVFKEFRNLDATITHDLIIGKIANVAWSIQYVANGFNAADATLKFYGTNFPDTEANWVELPSSSQTIASGTSTGSVGLSTYQLLTLRVLYTPNTNSAGTIDIIGNGQK